MMDHYSLDDAEFERLFRNGSFDPALFNHEAHLRLAWIHIRRYGRKQAMENITGQLLDFVKGLGAEEKFHYSLTIAAVKAVGHFIEKSRSNDFKTFINEFPRLKTHFREIIGQHYSDSLIYSREARASFIQPDLLPFT